MAGGIKGPHIDHVILDEVPALETYRRMAAEDPVFQGLRKYAESFTEATVEQMEMSDLLYRALFAEMFVEPPGGAKSATTWDSENADPLADMRAMVEKMRKQPYVPPVDPLTTRQKRLLALCLEQL